jgi:hypothetical protein
MAVSAALALMVTACAGAPRPTTSPDQTPTASPSGTPQPTPATPRPTTSPSPLPEATDAPAASPGAGGIDHPTGATDVILQMEMGGGFVPIGAVVTQAPTFTLYGDGTFILRPLEDPDRPDMFRDGLPRFLQGTMTDEYVQALLAQALGPGRLLDARDNYPTQCADCDSTFFTVDAAGVSRTVQVDGLGAFEDDGPDAAERRAFAQLRETIFGLEQRARSGELGEVVIYDAELYRVTLMETFGDPPVEPVEWPWPDMAPDDFASVGDNQFLQAVMSRQDIELLLEVPSGGHMGQWVEAPDGTLWDVGVRPLLPHETATDLPLDG